jgi:soluble lytic murein transglycosylase
VCALALFLAATTYAAEEIYYWKDEHGVFHYRDAPAPGWSSIEAFGLLEAEDAGISRRRTPDFFGGVTGPSVGLGNRYDSLIERYAQVYDVEAALVKAIIHAESNFNPRAISRQGARGLMQLMPRTARRHDVIDVFHPGDNIRGGVKELRGLLDRFGSRSLTWVIAAYNAGVNAVERHRGVPPYQETRQFVKKVLRLRRIYHREAQLASR